MMIDECSRTHQELLPDNFISPIRITSTQVIMSDTTTDIEIERLLAKYEYLVGKQYDALQKSSYAHMNKRDADAYDNRLLRIIEIRRQLARCGAEGNKA
jgi:hypothetical protein